MRLAAGDRLGPYEIVGTLGAGGMGEVYRARDTRLGREVAVKTLPAERMADEGRRRRFVQEARAASALNHPNIVTIHEIESAEGIDFIVMEYVPGQTLDGLIPKQGMKLGEALRVAIPIADALVAAHSRGIVHRDLKPANVIVTREGVVKVLDFGLAKLVADETDDSSETLTTASGSGVLTRPGVVTGTAGYMSPEQATGGKVDARSDVFSFGAVLYEMVTGRRAFAGKTVSETLAAVVSDQPQAPREVVPEIPEALERLILRCLRKEAERRFQHVSDVKVELQEVKEESDSHRAVPATAELKRRSGRRWFAWTVAVILLLAVVAGTLWFLRRPELPAPTVVQLTSERRVNGGSFSPDGTQIAYYSTGKGDNFDIWLKIVGQAESRRLTTDPAADIFPAWSPDGTQIAFTRFNSALRPGTIYLVSPLGGGERRLSDFPAWPVLSWSPDGRWLAAARRGTADSPPGGIHFLSVASGEARAVTSPKPPAFDVGPSFSPDGRALAYVTCVGTDTGLLSVFGLPCSAFVVALDSELRPQGAARPLTPQWMGTGGLTWTRDGRSIVCAGGDYVWRVPADGGTAPERLELAGHGGWPSAAAGRDRLAFVRSEQRVDIYRLPLGGSPSPILESSLGDGMPQYSPDGRQIAFQSGRAGGQVEIWLADADGANPTRLTRGPGTRQELPRWSPDGRSIVFYSMVEKDRRQDVWVIGRDGSGLRQITHDPADENMASWSRDGRFIYFDSNRTGRYEVWRVPVGGGPEEQLTRDGGVVPLESLDGRTLYYQARPDGPLLARATSGGGLRTVSPCAPGWHGWAVGPQGVFHADCTAPGAPPSRQQTLRYWDAATGRDRPVAAVEGEWVGGLAVSPDGQSLLYGRSTASTSLMMIENFR
jgi:serine/threonine protein kinase